MWRVLVIEDSPTNMLLTTEILGFAGHEALEATTAGAGIERAKRDHPDVILMDIHLPDMDGFEAAKILKGDPTTAGIPIIAVTAGIAPGEEIPETNSGFDGYLAKPIGYKDFLATVEAVLGGKRPPAL